jgi:hypothetical protein
MELPAKACDTIAASHETLRLKFGLHAPRYIRFAALLMHSLDGLKALISPRTLRRTAARSGMKAAARNCKNAAKNSNRIFQPQSLHDRVLGSDSRAKYVAAFLLYLAPFWLPPAPCAASSPPLTLLPGAVTAPLPSLTALTHVANVPNGMAIRFDASFIVRPCARTIFTASSRSSGVYVLGFVICAPIGEVAKKECPKNSEYLQRSPSCRSIFVCWKRAEHASRCDGRNISTFLGLKYSRWAAQTIQGGSGLRVRLRHLGDVLSARDSVKSFDKRIAVSYCLSAKA